MKKIIVMALVLGLVAGMAVSPATAKKKKKKKKPVKVEREAFGTYDSPAIGHPSAVAFCSGSTGCAQIALEPKERWVKLEIEDATGLPVYALAGQDTDGDNFADVSFTFCGSTGDEPIEVEPGYEINIFISAGPGAPPACAGVGTSGRVAAVLSNLP